MLKRMSLVFTLLLALVGIAGVQAQAAAEPQSMAQYLPGDAELFFSIRTDGAFLDELSDLVNGVVEKLPAPLQEQAEMLDLRNQIESQVGPISETGVGDYLAVGVSNTAVIYDEDKSNDDEAVYYAVVDLADRAKFEAFFEKAVPNAEKSEADGSSVYSNPDGEGSLIVTDDVAYITNQAGAPSGETLADNSAFGDALGNLPEANYNFVVYADFGPLMEMTLSQLPDDSAAMFDMMGINLADLGPIAVGGTVLDEKSLVIDVYSPSFGSMMPQTGPVDPAFLNNVPAGFSFVVHGTDLKTSFDTSLDLVYKMQEQNSNSNSEMPTREEINTQLKAFLGIDLDNDILGWMGGDYVLVADVDMLPILEMMESGDLGEPALDPRFAFIIEGDGSEKPGKVVQTIGNLLVAQTKDMEDAPKIDLSTEEGSSTIVISDIPLSESPEMSLSIKVVGTGDYFIVGDEATVDAIVSGDGDRLPGDASFVEAQTYILPNASSIAYAGGDGWGDLITLGGVMASAFSASSSSDENAQQMQMIGSVLRAGYDVISSSSLSVTYNEDGSQLSRAVLTLK